MICRPFAIQHSIIVAMSRDLHVWINYNNVTPPPLPNTFQFKLHYYLVGRTRPSIVNFSFEMKKVLNNIFEKGCLDSFWRMEVIFVFLWSVLAISMEKNCAFFPHLQVSKSRLNLASKLFWKLWETFKHTRIQWVRQWLINWCTSSMMTHKIL